MSLLESFLNTPNYQAVADISLIDKTTSGKVIFYDDNGYPFVAISEEEEVFIDLGGKTMFFATSKGFLYKFTVYSLTSVDGRPYTAISQLGNSNQNDYTQKLQDVYEDLMTNVFVGCCECGGGSSGILWYDTFEDFPVTGVVDTLYVDKATPALYFWDGAAYVSFGGGGSFVPYTGATGDVDLGANGLTTDFVKYNVTPVSTLSVGQTQWNDTDGTLDVRLKGNNVTLQVGQEQLVRVVNKVGSNLTEAAYSAVRSRLVAEGGAAGQRIAVVLAQADTVDNCSTTLGIVTEDISNNQEGFVTTSGVVRSINTTGALQSETWADGDVLYLSSSVAGGLTNVQPTTPDYIVVMGYVVHAHATQGKIYVGVQNDYRLNDLPYIPLAGTNLGSPVTGEIETQARIFYQDGDFVNEFLLNFGGDILLRFFNGTNGYSNQFVLGQFETAISGDDPSYMGATYAADYSSNFTLRSLIDLETLKQRFWTKAGTPTTTDDSTQGFVVGSLIYDTTNNILYRCTSNTAGAAVWVKETFGGFQNFKMATSGGQFPSGATRWILLDGFSSAVTFTSSDNTAVKIIKGGLIDSFSCYITNSQPASGSLVLEIFKGTTPTSLSATGVQITIPAGSAAGEYPTSSTATINDGDYVAVRVVNNASTNSARITSHSSRLNII